MRTSPTAFAGVRYQPKNTEDDINHSSSHIIVLFKNNSYNTLTNLKSRTSSGGLEFSGDGKNTIDEELKHLICSQTKPKAHRPSHLKFEWDYDKYEWDFHSHL